MDNLDDLLGAATVETQEQGDTVEKEEVVETKTTEEPADKEPESKESDPEKVVLVPHSALHEERERRKELQKKVAEQEERNAKIEERQNKILEALAARQQPQEEEQYVDPITRLENELRELKGGLQKTQTQIDADNLAIQKEQQLVNKYKGSVDAFTKDSPDFMDARLFLINDKVKELKALDYSDMEIAQEIKAIEKQIVERAYSKEQNPAEAIYKIAKEKGYKKVEPKTVEDIDKGLKASKSLGNGGKVSGSEDSLSNVDFGEMSDEEFNAFFSKLEKQSKRA